jgi:hypothetical protein
MKKWFFGGEGLSILMAAAVFTTGCVTPTPSSQQQERFFRTVSTIAV